LQSVVFVGWCVRSLDCVFVRSLCWGRISRKRLEKRLGFNGSQIKMAYGESNGHVIDDVALPVAGGQNCAQAWRRLRTTSAHLIIITLLTYAEMRYGNLL